MAIVAVHRPGIDVDYLFCQVWVDKAEVSTQQNCGNILAGVAPFAIERGLIAGDHPETVVRIFMVNTNQTVATVQTPGGRRAITVTPPSTASGTAAPIRSASLTRPVRPAVRCSRPAARWTSSMVRVTCIDNGMPVVVMRAGDLGRTGDETRDALDKDTELKARIEAIRLAAGPMMNLDDVTTKTVPKMILVSPPRERSHAVLHPAPLPRDDRRLRRPERRHGVPAARRAGARRGGDAARPPPAHTRGAPDRHCAGAADGRGRSGHEEVTEGAIISTARALFVGQVLVPESALAARAEVVSR